MTAKGVRNSTWIEVDSVYEGEGTCQVKPACFCLLQLDCLTPVKPGLFQWRSLALSLDRRSGVLAHLACCAQARFCLCTLSPCLTQPVHRACGVCISCPYLSDLTLYLESVLLRLLAVRMLQDTVSKRKNWIRGSDQCLSRMVNAFVSLASSCHVPLFTFHYPSFWLDFKGLNRCRLQSFTCDMWPYHNTVSDCMCLGYF